jgi:hypothetical protein
LHSAADAAVFTFEAYRIGKDHFWGVQGKGEVSNWLNLDCAVKKQILFRLFENGSERIGRVSKTGND